MDRIGRTSRRAFLASGVAAGAALAGCLGGGEDAPPFDADAWRDVTEISLRGHGRRGWTGVAPAAIEGVTNPTLGLVAGREYVLTWENDDGGLHNVELRDGEDETRYGTELMADRGATQTLEFEATADLAVYLCRPHRNTMVGAVELVDA